MEGILDIAIAIKDPAAVLINPYCQRRDTFAPPVAEIPQKWAFR
jgi:hypothetical protein